MNDIHAVLIIAAEARNEALAQEKYDSAKYWQGFIDGAERAMASKPLLISAAPDLIAAMAIAKATGGER